MTVHFIGAGPGAADLMTLRGQQLLATSAVCLYAGSLVAPELLEHCPQGARLVDTGPLTLAQITQELVDADALGLDVARLHSGDLSVYSALAEQQRELEAAGIDYDITPGVPAFAAAAAALRQELTVPGVSQTVILTRASARSTPMPAGEDLTSLATSGATMVIHLAIQRVRQVALELSDSFGASCPVAVVAWASRADEVILRGTLADIADAVQAAGITRGAVIIVGRVLPLNPAGAIDSHLYSADRDRSELRY